MAIHGTDGERRRWARITSATVAQSATPLRASSIPHLQVARVAQGEDDQVRHQDPVLDVLDPQ